MKNQIKNKINIFQILRYESQNKNEYYAICPLKDGYHEKFESVLERTSFQLINVQQNHFPPARLDLFLLWWKPAKKVSASNRDDLKLSSRWFALLNEMV